MMKWPIPSDNQVDLMSLDDEVADMDTDGDPADHKQVTDIRNNEITDRKSFEASLIRKAKMYQEYMKKVSIPSQRGSIIPCNTWLGLAKSMKELYGQPLHYLTNILLKQWDQARFETGEEFQPLDTIIHPLKAEATVWLVEEIHRRTASDHQLSKLWVSDPMHRAFVDPVFPKLTS